QRLRCIERPASRIIAPLRAPGTLPRPGVFFVFVTPLIASPKGRVMPLSVGIVGLPNVGKSTTFNALSKAQNAEAANYPFCTIEPNKAVVPVPDPRLDALVAIAKPEKVLYSTVEFYDIAGLVAGASRGEGL